MRHHICWENGSTFNGAVTYYAYYDLGRGVESNIQKPPNYLQVLYLSTYNRNVVEEDELTTEEHANEQP